LPRVYDYAYMFMQFQGSATLAGMRQRRHELPGIHDIGIFQEGGGVAMTREGGGEH